MSINDNQPQKILITLLLLSLAFLFLSCGSRKVLKSVVKESLHTEKTVTENKDINTNKEIKTVIEEEIEEVEVTPIDNEKEIIVNGRTYKNASITIRKKKVNTLINAKENVKDNSVKKADTTTTKKAQTKTNDTQRKSNPLLNLFWLLIPAAAYFIYKKHFFTLW